MPQVFAIEATAATTAVIGFSSQQSESNYIQSQEAHRFYFFPTLFVQF